MAGVEEIKLHISAAVEDVERAISGMRGLIDQLDEAIARLRLITAGSAHPRAAEAMLRIEAAKEKLVEAHTLAGGGVEAAQAYHAII